MPDSSLVDRTASKRLNSVRTKRLRSGPVARRIAWSLLGGGSLALGLCGRSCSRLESFPVAGADERRLGVDSSDFESYRPHSAPRAGAASSKGAAHVLPPGQRKEQVERWSVAGRIEGEGHPLSGASACAIDATPGERCTLSDASGRFELSSPGPLPGSILVSASGYRSQHVVLEAHESDEALLVRLFPSDGNTVEGMVLDANGGPIIGAHVSARSSVALLGSTESDEAGRFRLDVPSGITQVRAELVPYSIAARVVEAPSAGVQLVLALAGGIEGTVRDGSGEARVAGAVISVVNANALPVPPQEVSSDELGRFVVQGLAAGGYSLVATAEAGVSEPAWVSVSSGESTEHVELLLRPASIVEGAIRLDGAPCPEGQLELVGDTYHSAATDATGRARVLGVRPGRYRMKALCEGAVPSDETIALESEIVTRRFELTRGLVLSGRVQRASGEPLPYGRVLVTPIPDESALNPDAPPTPLDQLECLADQSGQFRCSGLRPGSYSCSLASERPDSSPPVLANVAADNHQEVVVTAPASGSIRVGFAGRQTAPAVVAQRLDDSAVFSPARQSERLVFEGLPLGTYALHVAGAKVSARAVLANDGETVDIDLAPPATSSLGGRVIDERNEPVLDAWVRAANVDPELGVSALGEATGLTDETGRFFLEDLPEGQYTLRVTSPHASAVLDARSGDKDVLVRLSDLPAGVR